MIPVMAVTGIPQSIKAIDKKYLSGILEKPFTPDLLLKSIQSVLLSKTNALV